MASLRRILWTTLETDYLYPTTEQGPWTQEAVFHHEGLGHKFTFDNIVIGDDEACSLCNEANTVYVVCANPAWVPSTLARPNAIKHFPGGAVVYEYSEGICLLVVQCGPGTNNRETNAVLMALTNLLRAIQAEDGYRPFNQHPVTRHLRAQGYMQPSDSVVVVVRLESEESTLEECLRLLRFSSNLRLSVAPTTAPNPNPPDVSPPKKVSSPTKTPSDPLRLLPQQDSSVLHSVKHENIELQDLVVKMAGQIQELQRERTVLIERQAKNTAATVRRQDYEDLVKKNKDMERKELERIRNRILTKASPSADNRKSTSASMRRSDSSPGPTSRGHIGPSEEAKNKIKQQSAMIATMRKKELAMEAELIDLRRKEKVRAQSGHVAAVACEAVRRRAQSLEEHCARVTPNNDHPSGVSAVRAALQQLQVTAQRLQGPSSDEPMMLTPETDLYAVQSRCLHDWQQLAGTLSLLDTFFKLEQALQVQR